VLRALVRADEIWLVVLAAFLGCGTGIIVWLMTSTTQFIHEVLFGIAHTQRLSGMQYVDPLRTMAVPALGGLVLGLLGLVLVRVRPRRTVDPIEALCSAAACP
jgi:CIC family chloride channel protein